MAPTHHPRSLDELTELSRPTTYDPGRTFKDQLRAIDALRNLSIHHKEKNDPENAYIYMAQAAAIMLEKLPHHSQYDILTPRQKKDLASNGATMLKLLEELKPQLQERYKKYKEGLANGVIIPSRKRKDDKNKATYSFEERAQYPRTPNYIEESALRFQPSVNSTSGVIITLSESQEREPRGVERSSRNPSRDPRNSSGHRIPTPSPTPSREPPSTLTGRSHRLNEPVDVGYRRESSDEENRRGNLLQAMRQMQQKFGADLEARLTDPAPLSESARRRQALEVVENTGIAERLWIEEKDRRLNGGRRSSTCERELRDQAILQGEREAHVNKLFDDRARGIEAKEREEVKARIARELSKRAEEQLKAEQNAEAQARADALARAEARTQVEEKERQRKSEEVQAKTSREWDEQRMPHEVSERHIHSSLDWSQQPHQHQPPPILRPPLPSNPPQSNNHSANVGSLINADRALRRGETHGPTSISVHHPQPVVRGQSVPIIPIVPSVTPIIPSYPVTPTSNEHPPSMSTSHDHINSRVHVPPLHIPQGHPPKRYDELALGLGPLPLESPTRPRGSFQGSSEEPRNPNREARQRSYPSPITTTSPLPRELVPFLSMPPNLMSSHQRSQGYAPSSDSMFAPKSPQQDGTPNALLFQPIGVTEVPSKPDTHLGVVPWPNQPPRSRGPSPVPGFASMRNSPYPDPKSGPLQLPTSSHYHSGPGHSRQNTTVTPGQLRKVALPTSTLSRFLSIAALNTSQKRETCGLLLGRPSRAGFEISTLLIPKQTATESTCSMTNEELVAEIQEKRGLMTLGWIHTHPTQSCFMSSLDLHTHSGYQSSLPEAVAIVCAPNHTPSVGIFRLTDPPGLGIVLSCTEKAPFHPHSDSQPIYTDVVSDHVQMIEDARLEIIDLR